MVQMQTNSDINVLRYFYIYGFMYVCPTDCGRMSETDCCELPCSETLGISDHGYSQAEYLRVRNTLVQVLEELKLRRVRVSE